MENDPAARTPPNLSPPVVPLSPHLATSRMSLSPRRFPENVRWLRIQPSCRKGTLVLAEPQPAPPGERVCPPPHLIPSGTALTCARYLQRVLVRGRGPGPATEPSSNRPRLRHGKPPRSRSSPTVPRAL